MQGERDLKHEILAELALSDGPLTVFQLRRHLLINRDDTIHGLLEVIEDLKRERMIEESGSPLFEYRLGFKGRERIEQLVWKGLKAEALEIQAVSA